MAAPTIDLNCDLGEGGDDDDQLIPLVTSVNVACGGHAGDDRTMRQAVTVARAHGVAVGAHPGYEDRPNFGRVAVTLPADVVVASVVRQVRRLADIAADAGGRIGHVKPHGALYHAADADPVLADALVRALAAIDPRLVLVGPPNGHLAAAALAFGTRFVAEGFADRRYLPDGRLVPRAQPGATLDDPAAAAEQAVRIVTRGSAVAVDGTVVGLPVATLCTHGDGAHAITVLAHVRRRLLDHGVVLRAFCSVV